MQTNGDGTLALYRYRYPEQRQRKARSRSTESVEFVWQDKDGQAEGVIGSVDCLSHVNFSSQPISCFDWSPDKEGLFVSGALDQCIRVGIVTKLKSFR